MNTIPNMHGKSVAMLHNLFQNWLRAEYPFAGDLSIREINLMWKSFQAAHRVRIVGLHEQIAELKEQLDMYDAREYDRQQEDD